MGSVEMFLLGAAGACAAEMLKLYERRSSLTDARFRQMIRSPKVWTLGIGMALASGLVAWAAHESVEGIRAWPVVLTGIGASGLLRLAPQTVIARSRATHLDQYSDADGVRDLYGKYGRTEDMREDEDDSVQLGTSDPVMDFYS